jgi:hypothetical protein
MIKRPHTPEDSQDNTTILPDGSILLDTQDLAFQEGDLPFPNTLPQEIADLTRENRGTIELPDGGKIWKTHDIRAGKDTIIYQPPPYTTGGERMFSVYDFETRTYLYTLNIPFTTSI